MLDINVDVDCIHRRTRRYIRRHRRRRRCKNRF